VTAVVVIVLASVIGFASTLGPVTAASPARNSATAPPARGPGASPGQPPAARSVVKQRPAAPNPDVGPAVAEADLVGPGHGHGKGPDHVPGHGKAKNKGSG
jgi:hypothetical protein